MCLRCLKLLLFLPFFIFLVLISLYFMSSVAEPNSGSGPVAIRCQPRCKVKATLVRNSWRVDWNAECCRSIPKIVEKLLYDDDEIVAFVS